MRKILVGLVEPVKIKVQKGFIEILGKFDTGAKRTSIDKNLASKIKLKRVGEITTKSVHGKSMRPLVDLKLRIKGKNVRVVANIADRSTRKYKLLLGRDAIFPNFIIDITKSHKSHRLRDIK
jgi:hypothetical protein